MEADERPTAADVTSILLHAPEAAAASWHPAQRPDTDTSHVEHSISTTTGEDGGDDFFNGLASGSAEAQSVHVEQESITNVSEVLSYEKAHSLSADIVQDGGLEAEISDNRQSLLTSDTLPSQPVPAPAPAQVPPATTAEEDDEEAAVFQPSDSARKQEQDLEDQIPSAEPSEAEAGAEEQNAQGSQLAVDAEASNDPGLGYSHQGEVTEMDEAVDEAPNAPLMMDPEAAPTVEETEGGSEQPAAEESIEQPHFDRSFTTNFTEVPKIIEDVEHASPPATQHVDDGWPAVGDDKTFGELLDNEEPTLKISHDAHPERPQTANDDWGSFGHDETFGELLGSQRPSTQETEAVSKSTDEDLAAMWQAALDDDELLSDANDMDPSAFFGDDDEGFLEDDLLSDATSSQPIPATTQQRAAAYLPANAAQSSETASHGMFNQSHARSAATPDTGLHDLYGRSMPPQPSPLRQDPRNSASFVDKAKGGYQSPYDLPMDVVKQPRQRPRPAAPTSSQSVATPPPRIASQSALPGQTPPPQAAPPASSTAQSATPPAANGVSSSKPSQSADSGFFADLPVSNKPRSRLSGIYAPSPQLSQTPPPPAQVPPQPFQHSAAPPVQPLQQPTAPYAATQNPSAMYSGLTRPEQLPLLPDQPTTALPNEVPSMPPPNQRYSPNSQSPPTQNQNRYSPTPAAQAAAPSTSRYSPAPTPQQGQPRRFPSGSNGPPGIQQAHPFAPRTSSPLAFSHEKPQLQPQQQLGDGFRASATTPASPPKTNGTRSTVSASPERPATRNYSPSEHQSPGTSDLNASPQRPNTRSPPAVMKTPKYSVHSTPSTTVSPSKPVTLAHRRQFSRELAFVAPADERAQDPLERWKGHPIFHWGAAGSIVHSFPKQTPFYAAGQAVPSVKCTPGVIVTQEAPSFLPLDDRNATFPGPLPLRAKGKKKDVVAWMSKKIEELERLAEAAKSDFSMIPELKKRAEEKMVLWKLVKIFVEHDGSLDTNQKLETEVRAILLPNLAQMGQVMELESPASASATAHGDAIDRSVIIQLRQALLEGQRERAVWLAEEKKLWGHAMLIASTMGADTWRQVIQSFVRSQVKTVGSDARALAALYQVFAGNAEECVDELVPPSARAGFKMVSKIDRSSSGDPLEGLDQWRETLGLVAGNRTPNDAASLLALGQMLSGYGRAEAAHSCFLFARQLLKHGGTDDAEAHFVLLGANHKIADESCGGDLDCILLTEIYEWASSLSAPSAAVQYAPHLQSFKLIHAQQLAAYGMKTKAQAYCDHITSAYTSTTRPSPYYHPTFTQSVNELSAFLSQTPHSGPQSLLSKTAMNKVSSGAASWFTKFVSGDDDQSSVGSGPGASTDEMMSGPFGRVNGDSPDLSHNGSSTDLYNPMMGGGMSMMGAPATSGPMQQFQASSAPSRYTPMGRYAPTSNNSLGISTTDAQRPSSSRSYVPSTITQALDIPRSSFAHAAADYNISRPGSAIEVGSQGSYEPKPLLADEVPAAYGGYQPYAPEPAAAAADTTDPFGQPQVPPMFNNSAPEAEYTGYQSPSGGYEPPSGGYEPPSGGYEPPSYQPYEPEPEAAEDTSAPKPKKKGFMDDDDDDGLAKRSAAMQKAQADREADDAFKKAAEADAARDKDKGGNRKSWFGGFFKKDANAQQPGPIRAKLGEENSFVYDENLKKWVNKKAGAEAAAPVAATPPPPKGPVNRVASGGSGPPSGPPSRVSSIGGLSSINGPPGHPPMSNSIPTGGSPAMGPSSGPPSRVGTPLTGSDAGPPLHAAVTAVNSEATSSGPPSRPATGMSNASSLDDLLGGPPGPGRRAGGAKNKKKGGRYVDVMATS